MRMGLRGSRLTAVVISILLLSSGGGAAVGAVLAARLIGNAPITVTQALRVQEPVVVGMVGQVQHFVSVDDSGTKFTTAATMPQGSSVTFKVPMNNSSGRPLIVSLKLAVSDSSVDPSQVAVEANQLPADWAELLDQLLSMRQDLGNLLNGTTAQVVESRARSKITMAQQVNIRIGNSLGKTKGSSRKDARKDIIEVSTQSTEVVTYLQQALELEVSPDGQYAIQQAIARCNTIQNIINQLINRITAAIDATQQSPISVLTNVAGYGGVTNIAMVGPNEWKFELPADVAVPAVDGVLLTISSPPSAPLGFFRILADMHTVEY